MLAIDVRIIVHEQHDRSGQRYAEQVSIDPLAIAVVGPDGQRDHVDAANIHRVIRLVDCRARAVGGFVSGKIIRADKIDTLGDLVESLQRTRIDAIRRRRSAGGDRAGDLDVADRV